MITAADLLAEIGDCRQRYPTRDALACAAGQAAVAVESGKWRTAGFRRACNKRLRVAFCRLADSSRHWHPWAQDLYAQARQRGHDHPPRDPDRRARVVPRALAMLAATTPPTTPRDTTRCNATVTIPSPSGGQTDTEATRRLTRPGLWRPDLTEVATRT